jgi:hypothetical protein
MNVWCLSSEWSHHQSVVIGPAQMQTGAPDWPEWGPGLALGWPQTDPMLAQRRSLESMVYGRDPTLPAPRYPPLPPLDLMSEPYRGPVKGPSSNPEQSRTPPHHQPYSLDPPPQPPLLGSQLCVHTPSLGQVVAGPGMVHCGNTVILITTAAHLPLFRSSYQ